MWELLFARESAIDDAEAEPRPVGKRTRTARLPPRDPARRVAEGATPSAFAAPSARAGSTALDPYWFTSTPATGGAATGPVQRKPQAEPGALAPEELAQAGGEAAVAARGIAGPGEPLPFADTLQRAFGRHDLGSVRAHLGGAARASSLALGAEAFATGTHVAFAGLPTLHTAAHEAAHVVQQRAGLQFLGGRGPSDAAFEQHADQVADAVVAGASAEALLDQVAAPAGAAGDGSSGLQRKPIKDAETGERAYHDDQHPRLRLIKEPGSAGNEFRLKDRLQKVYWKDDSNYFLDAELAQPLDLSQHELTGGFGAFLETFHEASALEHGKADGAQAAELYLLQQFFCNALFDNQELERFDYQASPLNYQAEHAYIRAAATSNVEVVKEQLLGQEVENDKVFLSSQMELQETLHQMFRSIALDEVPSGDNLRPKLAPLAQGLCQHLRVRLDKREELRIENDLRKKDVDKRLRDIKGELGNINGTLKKQKREDLPPEDQALFDWLQSKEQFLAAQNALALVAKKQGELEALEKAPVVASPSPVTPDPLPPSGKTGKQAAKAKAPVDPEVLKNALRGAIAKLGPDAQRQTLATSMGALGVDPVAFGALGQEEAAAALEKLQQAKVATSGGGLAAQYQRLEELDQLQAAAQAEQRQLQGQRFDLMRGFDESFGGLAFLDFTALLAGMTPKDAQARVKEWGALASEVLLQLVSEGLADKLSPQQQEALRKELTSGKAAQKACVMGGMLDAQGKDGLASPALLVSDTTLAVPIKTALGKSGYVPTPASANRKLVEANVPLRTILLQIIDKQLARQSSDPDNRKLVGERLRALRAQIEAFDPATYQPVAAPDQRRDAAREAFARFQALASSPDDHVGLLVRPVIKLIEAVGVLDPSCPLPAFALRQLETHLQDAVANAKDVAALQRSVQSLHELILYALELDPEAPAAPKLDLPDGAQAPHLTPYGLTALSHTFQGVLQQHQASGGGKLEVAALGNIYFEMMQKLVYTQGASGGEVGLAQPSSAKDLLARFRSDHLTVKCPAVDLVILDIHPNDAAKREIHVNDVAGLLHHLFAETTDDFRCTVVVDITLNHIVEDEVVNIRNEARPYIDSGRLNLVFNQSLTKFAQFGADKHSGGLMFHFNDGAHWQQFNQYVQHCAQHDQVDPVIGKYFIALFQHTEKENLEYLQKVRLNSRYVYEALRQELQSVGCTEAISLAENDDPSTCYVAFHYETFAARVLNPTSQTYDEQVRQLAHDILYAGLYKVVGNLGLPLNMRTSFGFPLSNFGDIDPGIRLTVGIESQDLLDQYVKILTFINAAVGRELDTGGKDKLADPEMRKQFLAQVAESIQTLSDLDDQLTALRSGQGAKQTALPPSKAASSKGGAAAISTSLRGERSEAQIGAVPHLVNSCYLASLLNLVAATPAYRLLIEQHRQPADQDDAPDAPDAPDARQLLCERLHRAVTALRSLDQQVTEQMVADVRASLQALGFLSVPEAVGGKQDVTAASKDDSPSDAPNEHQQDAAEILQRLLTELEAPAELTVGEQGRKQQALDPQIVDHLAVQAQAVVQLPIYHPSITTLEGALQAYCAAEQVPDFGLKLITFQSLPQTLAIALKRFDYDNYGARKNYRRIEVPVEFEMPASCLHPDLVGQVVRYRLVSFVEHRGVYGGGHYVAHASDADHGWYRNDDQQDGPRKDTELDLVDGLTSSYLYVFEQVPQ